MAVTTVGRTIGTTGVFSLPQLCEDGAPADLTTSNNWSAGTFVGTFTQGEVVTGVGITGGKFLDTDQATYITFGTTTTPAAGITVTGSTSLATCVLSGTANVGVIWQGQCQNQEFSSSGVILIIGGSTESSTAYKEFTTVAGASFRDNASVQTNALRYNGANGAAIITTGSSTVVQIQEANCRLTNLQIANTNADGRGIVASNAVQTPILSNCIVECNSTSATNTRSNYIASGTAKNCLFVQRVTGADHIVGTGTGSPSYFNCTFAAPDDLATAPTNVFQGATGTVTVQNCGLFTGDSTKAIKAGTATFNFTTCYSDISGTGGVTQTTYSSEFENVNDATRDYRLKSGAAQIDTGTTDTTNAANDIAGTARPSGAAYDVSCWEFIAAAGGGNMDLIGGSLVNRSKVMGGRIGA